MADKKPNMLILWGDDVGWWNISYNSRGQMGYRTPNIDRVGNEGVAFTDYYAQQSCTAGRASSCASQRLRCVRSETSTPDQACVRAQHQLAMSAME